MKRHLSLEDRRFAFDAEMRRREMALKEKEQSTRGVSTSTATIAGAVLALASGLLGSYVSSRSSEKVANGTSAASVQVEKTKVDGDLQIEAQKEKAAEFLENRKFETSLIIEAIKTSSRSDAIRNLKFFVAAGFVSDPDGKIGKLNDNQLPSLGAPSDASTGRALKATGVLSTVIEGQSYACTGVAISARYVITSDFCLTRDKPGSKIDGATFNSGNFLHTMQFVKNYPGDFGVLKSTDVISSFLDTSKVRMPSAGESLYIALSTMGKSAIKIETCHITSVDEQGGIFEHDCYTGPGSSGGLLLASADDALLGLHFERNFDGRGKAKTLFKMLPELEPYLNNPVLTAAP